MTGSEGNSHKVICYIAKQNKSKFEKRAEVPATALGHLRSRATAVNSSWVTVNCFPFDVDHSFRNVAGSWRETVSLLDVM